MSSSLTAVRAPLSAPLHASHFQLTARRIVVAAGLASIAAIHVLDLPGKVKETPYLAVGYVIVIIGALVLMERMIIAASRIDYLASAVLGAAVLAGFIVNRTVGMPGATGDIGNWLEPLGLLSLVVEALLVWQAISGYVASRSHSAHAE